MLYSTTQNRIKDAYPTKMNTIFAQKEKIACTILAIKNGAQNGLRMKNLGTLSSSSMLELLVPLLMPIKSHAD